MSIPKGATHVDKDGNYWKLSGVKWSIYADLIARWISAVDAVEERWDIRSIS